MAGVINYVLRDDFDGFEVSGAYGDSTASTDEGRYSLNMVAGGGNERHHVMGIVDYYKRNAMFERDRDVSAESVRPSQQGFYPSFNDLFWMFYDQTEEPMVVTVLKNGDLYFNAGGDLDGTSAGLMDPETLVTTVSAIVRRNPEVQVLVGGDTAVEYGKIYDAMVLLQKAGVTKVGLMSNPLDDVPDA